MEIAICDNNELVLIEIEAQVKSLSMADNISAFSNLDSFLFSIDAGKRYDAVFMDINWGENNLTGIDVASELFNICPETKIIYVTGYVDFSQEIFLNHSNLSGFLTKPVDTKLLQKNLQKIKEHTPLEKQAQLVLQQNGRPVSIPIREIYYIESEGHTIHVHNTGEKITVYERLGNILDELPEGFCQCHKSYIVNMNRIRRFGDKEIIMKNNVCVPISRARYTQTKDAYFSYMGKKF